MPVHEGRFRGGFASLLRHDVCVLPSEWKDSSDVFGIIIDKVPIPSPKIRIFSIEIFPAERLISRPIQIKGVDELSKLPE
jgi:hypothetical protein